MPNLLENKLLLQYLSGAGAALSQGKPIGPALNDVTQQNIKSQNYIGLLKKILGDAANPETGSKASFDGKGLTYKMDMSTPPSVPGPLRPKSGGTVGGGGTTEQTANPLAKDLMSHTSGYSIGYWNRTAAGSNGSGEY